MRPWLCVNKFGVQQNITEIKSALKNLNIPQEGMHRQNSANNLPSTLIKFKTNSEESEKQLLRNGILLNNVKYTVRKYINKTVTRCTNCQQLGHLRSSCKNEKRCVRCAENTCKVGECKNNFRRCANCHGNHAAAYKNCPVYKNTTKTNFEIKQNKSYADILKQNTSQYKQLTTEISQLKSQLEPPKPKANSPKEKITIIKKLTSELTSALELNTEKTKILNKWINQLFDLILTGTTEMVPGKTSQWR